ncbi:hypothetical protein GN958_ATG08260 [Phytophthora infestans]|uniref:Uncharacterized protein n=1 Tax=Phytophthora infestans TaxID=4787 RepID=A0A8S9UU21_PHYIN|nr:hypothetical protein GN958_ATG08260 [Phytophthora infestans]
MARTSLALPASSLTAASLSIPNEMRYCSSCPGEEQWLRLQCRPNVNDDLYPITRLHLRTHHCGKYGELDLPPNASRSAAEYRAEVRGLPDLQQRAKGVMNGAGADGLRVGRADSVDQRAGRHERRGLGYRWHFVTYWRIYRRCQPTRVLTARYTSLQVAPLLKRQRRCRLQRPRQPQLQPPLPATPTAPPATPVATSCPTQGSITPSVSTSPPTKGPTTPPTTASITIMAPGTTTPLTDTPFYSYISHRSADYGSTNYVAAD